MFITEKTSLEGVLVLTPKIFSDKRGKFFTAMDSDFSKKTLLTIFHQHSHSISKSGVIRGLHYQYPKEQTKLVRVVSGKSFDVIIDIRPNSNNFGKWYGVELSSINRKQVFIPKGYAHGFMALEDETEIIYALGENYFPDAQHTIMWDDPDIGIDWPEGYNISVSKRDRQGKRLKTLLKN